MYRIHAEVHCTSTEREREQRDERRGKKVLWDQREAHLQERAFCAERQGTQSTNPNVTLMMMMITFALFLLLSSSCFFLCLLV